MQQNQPVPGRPLSRLASIFQRAPAPALEVEPLPPLRPIQTRPAVPSPPLVTPPQTPPVPSPKPAQTQVVTTPRQTSPRPAPSPPQPPSPKPAQIQVTTAQRETSPRPAPPSPKPAQTQVTTTQRQISPRLTPPPPPSPKPAQTQFTTTQRQISPRPTPPPPPSPKPEISQATAIAQPQASPKSAPTNYDRPWTSTAPPAPTSTALPASPKSAVQPQASLRPRAVAYRSLTPPQSPKIIKPSEPTPPPSPKTIQQQPKSIFSQYKNGNGNSKVTSDKKEPPVEKNHAHLSPKKGDVVTDGKIANNSTMPSGKKKAEKSKEEEQTGWRLITIAGENMGAYMELGSGYHKLQKQQPAATIFKYQHNSKPSEVQENEPQSDIKESMTVSKARPLAAMVNSNVQAINNSMVFNCSCTHKSPGVHLNVSSHRLPTGTSSSHPKKGE
ncbi:proteoglycan 4-like [Dioscorea cayenensis subsp. rotundata]|uniref:Proteoglycan 4-like n=1 Tax=Dioscorea cayennensis subsp. rotundata TaxID=55577 RepID=A0AB40C3F8_DIOCR|nr:proteoglycan 4-like [Dioscorea cayenensis subsp. rotundata]